MATVPMGYFEVAKLMGGIPVATSTGALFGLVALSALLMFGVSLFLCNDAQTRNCKGAKKFKTVLINAGIATAIQTGVLILGLFIPGLRDLNSRYFLGPAVPGSDEAVRCLAVDAGFWGAWGTAYGIAIGVTLAGAC
jgi:hypothetical protein